MQREEISIEQYMGMLTERIKRDQVHFTQKFTCVFGGGCLLSCLLAGLLACLAH